MKLTRCSSSNSGPSSFARGTELGQFLRSGSLFDFSSVFGNAAGSQLATDVYEDDNNYYARFEVPGVKKEDVKIELNNGSLSVAVEKRDGEQSRRVTRSLSVPESVAAASVGAKLEDGVLTVTLPKQEDRKPRNIQVA